MVFFLFCKIHISYTILYLNTFSIFYLVFSYKKLNILKGSFDCDFCRAQLNYWSINIFFETNFFLNFCWEEKQWIIRIGGVFINDVLHLAFEIRLKNSVYPLLEIRILGYSHLWTSSFYCLKLLKVGCSKVDHFFLGPPRNKDPQRNQMFANVLYLYGFTNVVIWKALTIEVRYYY